MADEPTDLGFTLLPADDEEIPPLDDIDAAEQSALEDDPPDPPEEEAPEPIGMSWVYDFDAGHFLMQGGAPAEAHGLDALRQWCLMALYTARYAHDVFSDDFGREEPEEPIGEVGVNELIPEIEQRIRETLLVHDRIAAVENFDATHDPQTGVLTIASFNVILDDETLLGIGDVQLPIEGEV